MHVQLPFSSCEKEELSLGVVALLCLVSMTECTCISWLHLVPVVLTLIVSSFQNVSVLAMQCSCVGGMCMHMGSMWKGPQSAHSYTCLLIAPLHV